MTMHPPPIRCDAAALVAEHYDLLYRYAYRLSGSHVDAEDMTQQTFLTAQASLGQLRDPSHARAWLCTILRNHFLKSRRERHESVTLPLDFLPDTADPEPDDFPVEPDELQAALAELPEEFRTPIVLFYFGEFSYKDIASQLDVPIGTIMSRLARGKAWLRRRLATLTPAAP